MTKPETISIASAADGREWDAFVNQHPNASAYHLWAWRTVFSGAFGHSCDYLIAREGGVITGVLPLVTLRTWLFGRFTVSLPFVNYGGVLASNADAAGALLDAASARAAASGLSHVELRHRERVFSTLPAKQHKVAMLLPLPPDADMMWDRLDRKVRNQVRKAEKSDLTVERGGPELLPEFYTVFTRNMRDLGTPVYSRAFFAAVVDAFPATTQVYVVRRGAQPIAAALSVAYRQTIEVPWAASLKEFRTLCPNNLLYWTIIRDAIESGAETFDFGRSTPNEGTFQFKRQWGAEPLPLFWEYHVVSPGARNGLPDQSPRNPRFKWAIEAWKRLPLGVTVLVGPPIVRGIP